MSSPGVLGRGVWSGPRPRLAGGREAGARDFHPSLGAACTLTIGRMGFVGIVVARRRAVIASSWPF